jgi:hypothetical protein
LEMIWMEAAVATFKVSLQGTILAFAWKDWGKPRTPKDSRSPSRDLKPGPPEYVRVNHSNTSFGFENMHIVTYSGFSIHDGTLLHSKVQYTTLDYSSQLF